MNNGAGCAVCCANLVYIDKPLLQLLVEGGVRSRWGGQKQSKAAEEGGREPAVCGQGEETPLLKTSGGTNIGASSGRNGKSLASGSHDRKHKLPRCNKCELLHAM